MTQREDRHRRPSGRERVRFLEGDLTASSATPVGATGGRRLRLRGSVEPLVVGGDMDLVRAGAEDLVVRDADTTDHALVQALARDPLTRDELTVAVGLDADLVGTKIDALAAAGVLTFDATSPQLDPEDAERFSRQLPYLAEYSDERDLQRRLAGARFTVVGCGGLGTWAVASLAAAGVRRFRLIDPDAVELSNLNRQAIYRPDQIGLAKVTAAADWLRRFDHRIDVRAEVAAIDGPAAARYAVEGADLLVLTADEPPYELGRWMNAACIEAGVPFMTAGQVPPVVRVGPLYVPGRTACFRCHETALRRQSLAYDEYVEHARSGMLRASTLGPASGIVGSMLAQELMHYLLGIEPATMSASVSIDIRTLETSTEPIPRDDGCPACSTLGRH